MNGGKRFKISQHPNKDFSLRPKAFIFIDKKTDTQRFKVKADADGSMPVDEAVSLLVVHCLMRNQRPNEFAVMVPAGENFLDGLRQHARKLIQACLLIEASIQQTGRQKEVLRGIQQTLSNKAIGMRPKQLGAGEDHGAGREIRISSERLVHINALERGSRGCLPSGGSSAKAQ